VAHFNFIGRDRRPSHLRERVLSQLLRIVAPGPATSVRHGGHRHAQHAESERPANSFNPSNPFRLYSKKPSPREIDATDRAHLRII
jgi:hypothetical protein